MGLLGLSFLQNGQSSHVLLFPICFKLSLIFYLLILTERAGILASHLFVVCGELVMIIDLEPGRVST